jgi:hypothetical protein
MTRDKKVAVQDVEKYEQIQSHVQALSEEMTGLVKKSPDAPLNKFKIRIVNERLRMANGLLTGIHKPLATFDQFSEEELPSASDVSLVISQYLNSLEGWRSANVVKIDFSWYWNTGTAEYKAEAPSRFRKRVY